MRSEWKSLSASVVRLVLAMRSTCKDGATYDGLRTLLAMSDVEKLVRRGVRAGMVRVNQAGAGRGARAYVSLTARARALLSEVVDA